MGIYEGNELFYVRTDHIARPVFATNASGTVVWEASYLPFGGVQSATGGPDLRFPGQWFQSESGLHQNWMRDYDPTLGRYLQADPLGLIDGASVYGYTLQNPARYADPYGATAIPLPCLTPAGLFVCGGAGLLIIYLSLDACIEYGLIDFGPLFPPYNLNDDVEEDRPEPPFPYPDGWDGESPPAPGWDWRPEGSEPGVDPGGWVSPDGDVSISPDFDHGGDIGPHIDLNTKGPKRKWRWFPNGDIVAK